MKKEFKRIKKVSKQIIGKTHYKKVKIVKDWTERTEGLKYLVVSKLQLRLLELESKLEEKISKNARLIELKLILLPSKIKIFKSTFNLRDYKVIEKMIKEIERDLEND